MNGILLKLRTWWETADRTQRVVTIFGSAFLALLLGGTIYFASRPKMALAYGGLTPADQGRIVAEIQKLGIPVEYDLMGNVRVPSDRVAEAQAMLAKNGVSPSSGHMGAGDRSSIGMMSPKSVEDAQLNSIREGEIAQTLEALNGVAAATVLLNAGEKSAFAQEDEPPSASVTITEDPGSDLSGPPAKAMASLVAKAVPGLQTKNVTIVNQDGMSLFDGAEAEGSAAVYTNKMQAQVTEARRIKRELQPLLDRFGIGATSLTVRVEMDFDKKSEKTVDIKPAKDPLTKTVAKEEMTGGKPGSGGAAGVDGGAAPGFATPGQGSDQKYSNSQSSTEFPYTQTTTETDRAPGTVTKLAISVLADDTIANPKAIQKALEGYLPADKVANKEFTVTVTTTKFDKSHAKALETAASGAAGRERMQQLMSLAPIGALIFVAFMIIKAMGKVAKSQNVLTLAYAGGAGSVRGEVRALPSGQHDHAMDDNYHPEAHPSLPAGPEGTPSSHPGAPGATGVVLEHEEPLHVRIGRINEKVNVPLEQIRKMSRERPEAVAMLLKSWLVEERR